MKTRGNCAVRTFIMCSHYKMLERLNQGDEVSSVPTTHGG
jgi:hypothetical protein